MKKYEGLIILDSSAKEEAIKDTIDKIQKDIEHAGGRIENVQKMGTRPLSQNIGARSAGFYVNYIFTAPAKTVGELDAKFHLTTDLVRWQFTILHPEKPRKPRTGPKAAGSKA